MPKLATVTLKGASGKTYEFSVYPRANLFKPLGAVYFMAKRIPQPEGGGDYTWIYVGETADLSKRPFDDMHKACIDRNEANSVCLHMEEDAEARRTIEADLREALDPPCNR